MEKYTDIHHPDYIPGSFNIYATLPREVGGERGSPNLLKSSIKKDQHGIVLIPQPSESPNDPLNWSKWRKTMHFVLMAFITAFTAATSNDAGATNDSLNSYYGISYSSMNTGAGVLFLGVGWSTLFFSPLPALYGRRITYLLCISLGLIGALWFARAKATRDVIWSQLFVGISESCAEAHVQLSLSDIFFQHQLGSVLTVYIMATSIGTFLGPLIAGYIATLTNFRWVGWCAAIISTLLLVWIFIGCEETYFDRKQYISAREDKEGYSDDAPLRLDGSEKDFKLFSERTISDDKSLYEEGIHSEALEPRKPYHRRIALITRASNLRGWGFEQYFKYLGINMRMFLFPPVWLSGLFWGIQDVFLSFYLTTQDTYFPEEPWNYSTYGVAIMNVPTLIGAVLGCIYAGLISDIFVLWLARRNNGILEAEYRLYFSAAAGIFGTMGLLMFGIGAAKALPWQVIYLGLGFIGFSWGCSGDIAMAYLMECYPEMVLEGMACTSVINNTLSCIFTFVCSYWLESMGTQNTYITLGLINLLITLLAIPMFIYGKRIRLWTKDWYINSVETRDTL